MILRLLAVIVLCLAFLAAPAAPIRADEGLRVVATVAPVHSLLAGVMEGTGQPRLLIGSARSPHAFALRPSQALALSEADVIFWIGPGLEGSLEKSLGTLAREARVVTLIETPGLTLLVWGEESPPESARDAVVDPHIWLDPENAKVLVNLVADELVAIDPRHAPLYRSNAMGLLGRLDALDAELRNVFGDFEAGPYLTFHNSFGYLENRYGLKKAQALTSSPDRAPGARRLAEIREWIKSGEIRCVFAEPQVAEALIEVVIEGTGIQAVVLDPLGAAWPPGPDSYFQMMRANAEAIKSCPKE